MPKGGDDWFVNQTYKPSTVDGGSGEDYIQGGKSADVLRGGSGDDEIHGGKGDDDLYGDGGDDLLIGGSEDDHMFGGDGADEIDGNSGNDTIYGGLGTDEIRGSTGDDDLYGGEGTDTLYGNAGDDDLYGDEDADTLYGNDGDDGLYGGEGVDELHGGDDEDRFLILTGESEHMDKDSNDALITFDSGEATWSQSDIESIDVGLAVVHRFTGDKTLLELQSGTEITFIRDAVHDANSTVRASNHRNRDITFYDYAFTGDKSVHQTVFHELGHNWDVESGITNWQDFKELSGWDKIDVDVNYTPSGGWSFSIESQDSDQSLSGDEEWYYDTSASSNFLRGQAKKDPREDYACVFALVFMEDMNEDYYDDSKFVAPNTLISAAQDKYDHIMGFLDSL